jgi:phosphatidylserine/phosphatidylglycerophosphate/cardiolipin synthase-like enzyme
MPARRQNPSTSFNRNLVMIVIFLAIIVIGYIQASQKQQPQPAPQPLPPGETAAVPDASNGLTLGWLKVYFTDPNPPDNLGNGIDQYVQPLIDNASKTIDVTSFDLNLPSLVNSLAAASKRGVKVRVVYDGTNGNHELENAATHNQPFDAIKTLKAAGVSLVDGGRDNGLMHDKMIIVDQKALFMGSWNLSYNDTFRNNNNLLRITDPKLIANYQAKFDELFVDKNFGTHAKVKVPYPSLLIGGDKVENYFSPEDGVMDKLVSYVQGAKKSVHFMIFTFTDETLATAMINQSKAGLDVQGVIENRGASQGAMPILYCANVPVRTDGNKYTMHHKVIIIDGQTVITGSFNFTKSADTVNDDNVLIIHNPTVAALYEKEYQKIMSAGKTPQASDVKCGK